MATHVGPDSDAIGSILGLAHALLRLNKTLLLLCDDPVPPEMRFLPGSSLLTTAVPEGFTPDLFIGVDASDKERLGKVSEAFLSGSLPVINIDHHVTNLNFGTYNLVDTVSAAAAEYLVLFVDALGVPLDQEIATCLLVGLVGDTRSFATNSVTPRTLQTAARLTEAGADIADVVARVFESRTYATLRLWGLTLSDLHLEDGVIWSTITYKDRQKADVLSEPQKGTSNFLLSAEEARISAVFTELEDGRVECSFRARPGHDIAQIALSLGGGGHPLASGCTIPGPLPDAAARVVALLKEEIRRHAG